MTTKPTHFIVVDDDAMNNMACKFSIKKHFGSPSISTFLEPDAALGMIRSDYSEMENKPTVLFLDINMPTMDAWEFLDAFSNLPSAIRAQFAIYILSSSSDDGDKEQAAAHPLVSGYIEKPLTGGAMEKVFKAFS